MTEGTNLLILERSTASLTKDGATGSYVLEGVFGEIGVKNKNNRIYDEKEILPHINELAAKAEQGVLLGELDHPAKFDISLKNVSHRITEVRYDKDKKQVLGKIEVLDTTAGKEAKALIDAGIPIHISSRAAGVVEGNGHVKIKKMFTYDLVADPGFANAQLERVNESFGLSDTGNIGIFQVNETMEDDKYSNDENKENTMEENNGNFVKTEDFNKYSKYLAEEISQLKGKLSEEDGDASVVKYAEELAEKLNKMHEYTSYLAENIDNVISHNNYVVENMNKVTGYMDYMAENLDKNIQYSEHLAENLDNSIQYTEHVAEGANTTSGQVTQLKGYADYLGENLDKNIKYSEYLKENLETVGGYTDYLGENLDKIGKKVFNISEDEESEVVNTPENETEEVETDNYKNEISEKLNSLFESAQKQTAELDGDLHFLRFVDKSKRDSFNAMKDEVKGSLTEAFKATTYYNNAQVDAIWETVMNPVVDRSLNIVADMPNEYKEAWDNISEARQSQILAESKYYSLNTQYKIDNFWQTRDMRQSPAPTTSINENSTATEAPSENKLGSEYANDFVNEMKRRLGR